MSLRAWCLLLVLAGAPMLAGCTTPETPEEAADDANGSADMDAMMQAAYDAAQNGTWSGSNGTWTSNSTNGTRANETSNSTAQYNYANCMRGMDMPGCPEEVADAYFDEMAKNAPPPDKTLPNVIIELDPEGAQAPGAFVVDAGAMQLFVTVSLNDTGAGAYATLGAPAAEDLRIELEGPEATETIAMGSGTIHAGASPAGPFAQTHQLTIKMPAPGEWTVRFVGQGVNVQADLRIVERFYL